MRHCLFILAILLTAAIGMCADSAPTTAPATAPEVDPSVTAFMKRIDAVAGDDALRQKLKERHNTAVHLLELRVAEYHKGISDVSPVFEAERLIAQAKLDLAQNVQEREAVMQQVVDVARVIESRLEKQLKSGFGSEADLERARLARQTAEVELLKLKQSNAAPTTQPR